eukprot:IDg14245t1
MLVKASKCTDPLSPPSIFESPEAVLTVSMQLCDSRAASLRANK